jgi:hypothetical protein
VNFVGGYDEQWWKLRNRFDRSLRSASKRLDPDGVRGLSLGSPVLVGSAGGDVIRVPVILRGGPRELPVAYVVIHELRIDGGRIDSLVERLQTQARAMMTGAPVAAGKDTEVAYP